MNKKLLHLEFLRIIAIILVIFNHTGEYGFHLFKHKQGSSLYWIYMFFAIACKVAVPLFWMISGALLIDKEETIKDVYSKRILRMGFVLIVFSFIQYLYNNIINASDKGVVYFIKKLYSDEWATAYWYIYAYLGILVLLPILRKMAKYMSNKEFVYLFVVTITITGIIPVVEFLLYEKQDILNGKFTGVFFSTNIMFFLMGYYIEKRIKEESLTYKKAAIWAFFGFVSIVISCLMTQLQINIIGKGTEGATQQFYNVLIAIPAFAIFYVARTFFSKIKIRSIIKKIIMLLGSVSFGVMLIENILRKELKFIVEELNDKIPDFSACVIWVMVVWICGVLISLILKQIPMLKKLL